MNAIIAQCGGPTPVINATLAAVIAEWQNNSRGVLYGSRYGFEGLLAADWSDLTRLDDQARQQLAQQPSAALGGSRFRPGDEDFARMIGNLHAAQIGVVFLIGGNGTMAGAQRLAAAAQSHGLVLQVIGIPKIIDNDLAGCDVTPGYGSAARYVAYTTQEIGLDLRAMRGFDQVAVVEVMGRHVGWLAAASALARHQAGDPPHLILLPETPVEIEQVLERIVEVHAQRQLCTVVVAEGVRERGGAYWAELVDGAAYDASGQRVFSMSAGASAYLVKKVQEQLGLRCRQIKLNTAQRATRLLASAVDRGLAEMVGKAAVAAWAAGASSALPVLVRVETGWQTRLVDIKSVITRERTMPAAFVDAQNYDVTEECLRYIGELIDEPPPEPVLWIE
jgi:ATP-dependent phosphofructokinase / diphosphate-dependent phosphofructokinase